MYWNPDSGELMLNLIPNLDAIIHLSGEPMGSKLWNPSHRLKVRRSRIDSTHFLVESMTRFRNPPPTLICASSCGYYGFEGHNPTGSVDASDESHESDGSDESHESDGSDESDESDGSDESGALGQGFLAKLCSDWEAAAAAYSSQTTRRRTVMLRFGTILSGGNGVLPEMTKRARLGLLPIWGSGKQRMPWICVDDAVYSIYHILTDFSIQGPVNICAPTTTTNQELTQLLHALYGKKTRFQMPEWLIRVIWGQIAKETILADCNATPKKLLDSGFEWQYPSLKKALKLQLGVE
jgi:NAD dependent epimerase/dehydratase family enzyme